MEAAKQIELFKEFVEKIYEKKLYELVSKGAKSLLIDFKELSEFSPELSEDVLDDPEETIKAAEVALSQIDMPELGVSESGFLNRVRFTNIPDSQGVHIKNIRSNHLNKFVVVDGIVRQTSDVRPQVTSAKFECPSCGNTLTILQIDSKFKEPSRCSCGRRGKFRLLSKELVDAQRIIIEESPENLEGGEQAKRIAVFLKEDLVEPRMEKKTTPGTKVRIMGILREVPIIAPGGGQLIRYDLMVECNYIEPIEEAFEELDLKKEDVDEIKQLAKDPLIYEKWIQSMAPSIYGHEDVKEALVLQLFGGVRKFKEDGTKTRGDIHVLLVGDPGCISGNSQVALFSKGMNKIQNLGKIHGQPIREVVTKIRKNQNDKGYDFATVFQKYKYQPVLKVVTETGKEVICTYNQPFLTKEGWKRADEIPLDTKIRVKPKIPNHVNKLADTNFTLVEKKSGVLKDVSIPEKFTEDLAGLCGYIIGDGNIHPTGYRVTCYVNEEETDLIEKISFMCKNTFNVDPIIYTKHANGNIKSIDDGNGLLRQFVSTQDIHLMEINSRQVAQSLSFLTTKRVPQQIFKSPKNVIAKFISWLFDADGCAFGIGRGRCSIQLKSKNIDLLKDVQLLLLYFGIQSRIIEDNLCIRRSFDMELFIKYIGFNSIKKKKALERVLEVIRNRNNNIKRKGYQRYEKVVKIIPFGFMDVYDFEVPLSHTFIANGIVCHNSGKSQLLQFISKAAPKCRFISGKGATSAGITASVVKDEFLKGFALEAGAIVLANKGIAVVDELDKMNPEDRSALHEALEQQTVTIVKANIQATLIAETTLLAAANPKLGRFDPYQPIAAQIDLPSTLINRFDLIFPVRDIPNKEKDEKIASHVLTLQQKPTSFGAEIPVKLLKRYISYAKQNIKPQLTDQAIDEIKTFYVELRNSNQGGEGVQPIPISARQLEALVRLSEASAKLKLRDKVTREDARRAIRILKYCLMQVGFDYETGKIDIDRINTGITASTRNKILTIKDIITELEGKVGKSIPIEDLINEAIEKGITKESVEEIIENLRRQGEVFEPRRGFISKI